MSRHKARETALRMLFQMDVGENSLETAKLTLSRSGLQGEFADFTLALVNGVKENWLAIDAYLDSFTKEWEIERLANVDRSIIRLAIYELFYAKDTPATIVMDEAIELAKAYSTEEAPAFINAILDGFYHKIVIEDRADFNIDEKMKERQAKIAAAAEAKIARVTAAEEVAVSTVEPPQKKAQHKVVYDQAKRVSEGQSYRIIKKAEVTTDDIIKAEDILADKKRLYGDNAYLTEKDLRKAERNGMTVSKELLDAVRREEKEREKAFANDKAKPDNKKKFTNKSKG